MKFYLEKNDIKHLENFYTVDIKEEKKILEEFLKEIGQFSVSE